MEERSRDDVPGPAYTEPSGRLAPRSIALITVVIIVLLVVIVAAGYGLVTYPSLTSVLRDIAIIVLALLTFIIGIFLLVLIIQLQSLTVVLRDEIRPILESANQTAGTVRGTTRFLSDAVVTPLISAASYVSAARASLRVLATGSGPRRRKERNRTTPDIE